MQERYHDNLVNDTLAIEIDGRILLLPSDCMDKSLGATEATQEDLDQIEDGRVRKVQVDEFLRTLLLGQEPDIDQEPEILTQVKDSRYYLDSVMFQVEDRRYLVPKFQFLQSTLFDSIKEVDAADGRKLLILDDVLKSDFLALLKVLYPMCPKAQPSRQDWFTAVKFAKKWNMHALRASIVKNLLSDSIPLLPRERVVIGREAGIPDLLRNGYVSLATQMESLSSDDFQMIGIEPALKLSQQIRRYRRVYNSRRDITFESASEKAPLQRALETAFFSNVYERASSVDVVERISLAEKHGVLEWIIAGYVDLASRHEDLTSEEVEKLGLETTVRICQVREQVKISNPVKFPSSGLSYRGSATIFDSRREVDVVFKEEFERIVAESIKCPGIGIQQDTTPLIPNALSALSESQNCPMPRKKKRRY